MRLPVPSECTLITGAPKRPLRGAGLHNPSVQWKGGPAGTSQRLHGSYAPPCAPSPALSSGPRYFPGLLCWGAGVAGRTVRTPARCLPGHGWKPQHPPPRPGHPEVSLGPTEPRPGGAAPGEAQTLRGPAWRLGPDGRRVSVKGREPAGLLEPPTIPPHWGSDTPRGEPPGPQGQGEVRVCSFCGFPEHQYLHVP